MRRYFASFIAVLIGMNLFAPTLDALPSALGDAPLCAAVQCTSVIQYYSGFALAPLQKVTAVILKIEVPVPEGRRDAGRPGKRSDTARSAAHHGITADRGAVTLHKKISPLDSVPGGGSLLAGTYFSLPDSADAVFNPAGPGDGIISLFLLLLVGVLLARGAIEASLSETTYYFRKSGRTRIRPDFFF